MHPKRHPITHRLHRRLRRRGPAHRRHGAASSATRAPTPRSAARCSSARPATPAARTACRTSTSRRSPSTRTTRRAARCAASARNQAAFAIEGCLDLLAKKAGLDGWEIRWRNALERRRRRSPPARCSRSRSASAKTLDAVKDAYYEARARRARRWASPAASRTAASATASPSGASARLVVEADGTRLALQRLHRDGPGPAHGARAVRRRGHRAAGLGLPPEGRLDLRARLRPDHRLARHAASAAARSRARRAKLRADLDAGRSLARPRRPRLRGGRW